ENRRVLEARKVFRDADFRQKDKECVKFIGGQFHVSESTHSLEAGSNFPAHKKKSRRVSLADSFFAK
ncbi:MAG: hypothetical protein FWF77_06670, partial [Defluviitaleaceae bacterium]|nr:hypothetical protein [Defluviitaleaceae bacterium]